MLNYADVIETLPCDIQNKETVTITTYQITKKTCECEHSQSCDPHHKHIKSGDVGITDNAKLRKLMAMKFNSRELNLTR